MLRSLAIRDFVIVDRLDLEFQSGFTALTGETGAGKSILIDALTLVLGERSDAGLVRAGCAKAEICAEFDVAALPRAQAWLEDNDLAEQPPACLLRRVLEAGGRSRAYINGRPVIQQQLKDLGEQLVNIHGQHEHQSLMRTAAQRELLDAFGGAAELAARVAQLWREWQALRAQREELERNSARIAEERERLEWQVRELDKLGFSAAEWETLQADHRRLAHAASLIESVEYALDALSEGEAAALATLNGVLSRLQQALAFDPALKEVLDVLEPAQIQMQEAVYSLRHYRDRLDLDPGRLQQVEQRLEAIHATARKHRITPERLPELSQSLAGRLAELGGSLNAEELNHKEQAVHAQYLSQAEKLSEVRHQAAERLSRDVSTLMQRLAMPGGCLEASLRHLPEGAASGLEQIEFLVAAHAGTAPRPLAKVASGGELSRIALAIQVAALEVAQVPTLVFDEVDAGIGGRVAQIVGSMLKQIGGEHQVMCITHLPQVAAAADQQWQVSKAERNGSVLSQVTVLEAGQRVEEIARMLGGVNITETTRRHAAEMLGAAVK